MWHDVFHEFNHKCGDAMKCENVRYVRDLFNTSICEQFNSFMNKIKNMGTHLSQSHFCFIVQYMIHKWNMEKDMNEERKRAAQARINVSTNV